ncbi:MAG: dienelactone hydrolase family protein [Verrucomicrobiales bacterium]|nr:dienelactone hydrolase family protein [Verrucomicrobiales bacterium]
MDAPPLNYLEVGASRQDAGLCVILMHGLGADGHDFADVADALSQAALPKKWRFVLPHAPAQPVTINNGSTMPAWYDILDLDHPRLVDWDTVATAQASIESLLGNEPANTTVIAGFSQGAAMALHVGLRHQDRIAGVLMMSGYLLESAQHPAPEPAPGTDLPIAIFHGSGDPVVPLSAGQQAAETLTSKGFSPQLKAYPGLQHSVSDAEIRDVFDWLTTLHAAASPGG